jgi:hypothetical protein
MVLNKVVLMFISIKKTLKTSMALMEETIMIEE